MATPTSGFTSSSYSLFLSSCYFLLFLSLSVEKSHANLDGRKAIESHFHTLQLTTLLPSSSCNPTTKGQRSGASLEIVNRHGPCSQLNQKGAKAPTLTDLLSHDQARVDSIQARITAQTQNQIQNFNLFKKKDSKSSKQKKVKESKANLPANSGLPLGTGNYIVTVGLGTPKKDLSLIFDTGSDLTWTQCQPCAKSCFAQQQPIFDPSSSTTYSNISCSSTSCSALKSATGNTPGCSASTSTCIYGIQYGDSSFSVGFFAKDKLTLSPNDVFDGFMFGCGENNKGLFGKTAGLIGLGRDSLSIVSQTAAKFGKYFSYCLPTSRGSNGHLTFGNAKSTKSQKASSLIFTPFSSSQGTSFYFIDITTISVGGKALSISPVIFKTAGTIIDSGTVITRLPSTAYGALRSAFRQFMSKYPTAPALSLLDTCYDLSNYTSISIPKISFGFNGNTAVDLNPNGILITNEPSQVCLAFAGNDDDDSIGIFGNVQQQTLEVVYDVAGGKLGFGYGGCS